MNDSIFSLNTSDSKLVGSWGEPDCFPCCKGLEVPDALGIQPGCIDWSSFGVAVVACVMAIITCVFTILMYRYVKKQLDTAKEQLEKQIAENEKNEKDRMKFMEDTQNYVDQINNQILIDSLASFLEKKHIFVFHFNELYMRIIEHVSYLNIKREKNANDTIKVDDYYEKVIDSIKDVEIYLGFMKDMLGILDKNKDITRGKIDRIMDMLKELKTKNGVADENEIDSWIDDLVQTKEDIINSIDMLYSTIRNRIK